MLCLFGFLEGVVRAGVNVMNIIFGYIFSPIFFAKIGVFLESQCYDIFSA
jgi:hypothetical protein